MNSARKRNGASRRFQWVINGRSTGPRFPFDIDLFDFQQVAVTPTLGAIVPGWILLVPREEAFCFAELSTDMRRSIYAAIEILRIKMQVFEGQHFLFEHGSRFCGSHIGCGVDQAHAHLVCIENNLLDLALYGDANLEWIKLDLNDAWSGVLADREYYFITDFTNTYVAYPKTGESQYFRKLVAQGLGRPHEWDYRVHEHVRNARLTAQQLAGRSESESAA